MALILFAVLGRRETKRAREQRLLLLLPQSRSGGSAFTGRGSSSELVRLGVLIHGTLRIAAGADSYWIRACGTACARRIGAPGFGAELG